MENNLRVFIQTFGCQMNVHDSENIKGFLSNAGYTFTDKEDEADIFILNTCMVRNTAEQRAIGRLNSFYKHKIDRNVIIGCAGCMSSAYGEALRKKIPHLDFVITTQDIPDIVEIINNALEHKRIFRNFRDNKFIPDNRNAIRANKFQAWVSIMKGCDNFCSYCIVPYTRGREQSRELSDVLDEINYLVNNGVKEIVLLGQNVNSFGKGLNDDSNFPRLLREINKINGDFWVRFMTSHPKDFSFELIDEIAKSDKLCNHIHLPLQSGSDRILKLMNRHYNMEKYDGIINKIKTSIPNCSITTDIIVGFPKETEEDFQLTLDAVKKFEYDGIFFFIYSDRTGTKAEKMENKIDDKIKHERFNRLMKLQEINTQKVHKGYMNKITKVLVERKSGKVEGQLFGHDYHNKVVLFDGDESLIGNFVNVKITEIGNWSLKGEKQ
jgi:tRNA-2-methylthio-N6-dimethylallyladenosine synthase